MKKKIAIIISYVLCSILITGNLAYAAGAGALSNQKTEKSYTIAIPSKSSANLIKEVHDDLKVTKLILSKEISSILSEDHYETDLWLLQNYSSITPNCPNLSEIAVPEENKTYTAKDGVLYTKDMKKLVYCPPGKTGRLVVPEGVESIGLMAFQECAKLTSISLPSTVSEIHEGAFGGNDKLVSLTISRDNPYFISKDNVLFYKKGEQLVAYAGGKKNRSYKIPDGVKVIAPAAFQGCKNLMEVTFCKDLTLIGNEAFRDCTNLTKVQLQEEIHEIAAGAFMNCSSLKAIYFPEGLRGIYEDALKGCNQLLFINLPSTIYDLESDLTDVSNRTIQCYSPFISHISDLEIKGKNIRVTAYKNSNLDLWLKKNIPAQRINYFNASYVKFDKAVVVADTVATGTGKPDTSWYQDGIKEFQISTPDQLAGLAQLVWNGNKFKGITIELTRDLDLSAYSNWTSIGGEKGAKARAFAGTFEGGNHCIYNLKINNSGGIVQGLFGINNGTIQNLELKNAQVFADTTAGLLAGSNYGEIINCVINGNITGNENIGGIAGRNGGSILDCTSNVKVKGNLSVGGIAGAVSGDILRCKAKGSVNGSYRAGGIGGYAHVGKIQDCSNYAIIKGETSIGGILGSINSDIDCSNCTNKASINGCDRVGGIVGEFGFGGTVRECVNKKAVDGTYYVGGIAGYLAVGNLSHSVNYGDVNGYYAVGGALGILSFVYPDYERISECSNQGKISGSHYMGDLIGKDVNKSGLPVLYWD